MRATFKLHDKDIMKVEATMTITMPLSEWEHLHNQTSGAWPGSDFRSAIYEMVSTATKEFHADHKYKEQT